jgi:transposase
MKKLAKGQVRQLRRFMQRERHLDTRLRMQMVVMREEGMTQPRIAELTGKSLSTVNRAHMAYDRGGRMALKGKPSGGRINEYMSVAEEKALLKRFAKAAGLGEMLNIHDLKAAYEKEIGHSACTATIYNLLHRHGWRKLMPRPHHPDRDEVAQIRFKKKIFVML